MCMAKLGKDSCHPWRSSWRQSKRFSFGWGSWIKAMHCLTPNYVWDSHRTVFTILYYSPSGKQLKKSITVFKESSPHLMKKLWSGTDDVDCAVMWNWRHWPCGTDDVGHVHGLHVIHYVSPRHTSINQLASHACRTVKVRDLLDRRVWDQEDDGSASEFPLPV